MLVNFSNLSTQLESKTGVKKKSIRVVYFSTSCSYQGLNCSSSSPPSFLLPEIRDSDILPLVRTTDSLPSTKSS